MFSSIKHIFFDLDDTLWDFEKNSSAVLAQLYHEYELSSKLKVDFDTFHSTYKTINSELWRSYYRREIDKPYLRNNRFQLVFNKFSYSNFEENLRVTADYLERSPYGTHLKDGCIETLEHLRKKFKLHIITNGFKEVQHIKLDNCGLRPYFQQVIISEEHDLTKPDERIFRLAEKLANAPTEQCLMIGDNYESDVEGALNAGWKSIYFTEEKVCVNSPVIDNLLCLKDIF